MDEAGAIASSVRGTSVEARAALAQALENQPPLPSSASVAGDLETIARDRAFDAHAALADLCAAILDEPAPRPSIRLDPGLDALEVRWPEIGPAVQLGVAIHRAAVRILERKFAGADYSVPILLEKFEDELAATVTAGVPEGSDPSEVRLGLRVHQVRAEACG